MRRAGSERTKRGDTGDEGDEVEAIPDANAVVDEWAVVVEA